jgi:hypothetical protein
MRNGARLTLFFLGAAAVAHADDTGVPVPPNPGFIELVDELDRHPNPGDAYCVDIAGPTVEIGDGLQAHNCHTDRRGRPADDQRFTTDFPNLGNLYATVGHVCVEAQDVLPGGLLHVVECSPSSSQLWVASDDGQIHPADDTSLCLSVETGPRGLPSGPGKNPARDLTLETCAEVHWKLTTWFVPGGSVGL